MTQLIAVKLKLFEDTTTAALETAVNDWLKARTPTWQFLSGRFFSDGTAVFYEITYTGN